MIVEGGRRDQIALARLMNPAPRTPRHVAFPLVGALLMLWGAVIILGWSYLLGNLTATAAIMVWVFRDDIDRTSGYE